MAQRRRARKDTRMDAALDAMRPYGFFEDLVQETVKELLKVYGEDGWYFFKNDSYKVLLDTILEKETNGTQEKHSSQDDTKTAAAGSTSIEGILPSYSNPEATYNGMQTNEGLDSIPQASEALDTASVTNDFDGKEPPPPAKGEGRGWKDNNLIKNSGEEHMDYQTSNNDEDDGDSKHLGNTLVCSSSTIHSLRPATSLSTQSVTPCYGWITSNDRQDLVHLTTASFPEQVAKFLSQMDGRRKRKTRWDVRPEDV